jgi:BlaI family transcriptional regulator, penicillinase repressor
MRTPPKPTDAELTILRVLWTRGSSTVREVARALGREGAYTTILKQLQIMADKRLVTRDESTRSHVYQAARSEQDTQRTLVADLLNRAFDGSAARLLMQALASRKASREELDEIEELIDKERGGRR